MSENPTAAEPARVMRPSGKFSPARLYRLVKKEWAETLRDRRTLVTLVLMPILVYPLLSIVFRQFLLTSYNPQAKVTAVIGVPDESTQERLVESLRLGERWLQERNAAEVATTIRIEPPLLEEPDLENIRFRAHSQIDDLRSGEIDVLLRWQETAGQPVGWHISFYENSTNSNVARGFVERRLRAVNIVLQLEAARGRLPEGIGVAYQILRHPKQVQTLLPTLVPLVLLLMTITGAVYPAIDLTAGERERGTLEALIAAPVSRMEVLVAKYVAVLTVALLTASINLVAMFTTVSSAGLSELILGAGGLSLSLVLKVFGLLLLFASFFSAVLLAITSFARSFKEAQAYLIPLMLLTLGPGLLSLSPTLVLNPLLAMTPLINVVLLARDLFLGSVQPSLALAVVVSTLIYAAIAIRIAAAIFGSDAILYGSEASWSQLWSRTGPRPAVPSLTLAMIGGLIALSLQIVLGPLLQRSATAWGPAGQIAGAALATLFIFAGLPMLMTRFERVPLRSALRWRSAPLVGWIAALLIGLSSGLLVMEATLVGAQSGWLQLGDELKKALEQKNAEFQQISVGWLLLCLAIVPACSEEIFFRGFLLSAFLRAGTFLGRGNSVLAIGSTAVIFALFHVISPGIALWERLLPSLLMGLLLAWLAWRTGSVLPGMLLHALNNSVLLLMARYRDQLLEQRWLPAHAEHLPAGWLALAATVTMAGLYLAHTSRSPRADVAFKS